jgi:hypothetical protein
MAIGRKMSARSQSSKKGLALLCAVVVWSSGCMFRRPAKASIADRVSLRTPAVPAGNAGNLGAPPDIPIEVPELPELVAVRSAPPRPHVVSAPATEPAKPEADTEPSIAPEFSNEESAAAKAETQRNLDAMEKNLTLSAGKSLNASQQDLLSKMRGFAENAREAMRTGDWVRAKNLSKKAEVLSEELADSL